MNKNKLSTLILGTALTAAGCWDPEPSPYNPYNNQYNPPNDPCNNVSQSQLQQYDQLLSQQYWDAQEITAGEKYDFIQGTADEVQSVADGNYQNAEVFLAAGGQRASSGGAFSGFMAE